jgi:hypothetical protein
MMKQVVLAAVAAAGLGAAGCGSKPDPAANQPTHRDALADIGRMLKLLADEGKPPPANKAELTQLDPLIPAAGPAVRAGEIVYLYGAGYAAAGIKVVAYETAASSSGGLVLLQDGTIKVMTAAEFAAAPKAK